MHTLMKTVQVKNVRSLKDTGRISLSPITILVGENSSGKSTFLRLFPLIRQSIQKKTNGPLLWAGDMDDYVDFGSYNETVTNDGSKSMSIGFTFDLLPGIDRYGYYYYVTRAFHREESPLSIHYAIDIKQADSKEYISKLFVEVNDIPFEISYSSSGKVNSIKVEGDTINFTIHDSKARDSDNYFFWHTGGYTGVFGGLMPDVSDLLRETYEKLLESNAERKDQLRRSLDSSMFMIGNELVKLKSLPEIEEDFLSQLALQEDEEFKRLIMDAIDVINHLRKTKKVFCSEIERIIKLFFLYVLFMDIETYIDSYFRQVHYIAPLRATAERYYRLRNSAIDEVDYQGKNLAIFLNSLPSKRMGEFQKWTMEHFGFKTVVQKTEGHLSVNVVEEGQSSQINLSDSGFGYSQILPIITQLWELSSRKKSHSRSEQVVPLVVAIEQPELHLHPAMQAKLAEAFIACLSLASKNGYCLQLLLETHSETIINYLGRAVERKRINPQDVSVVLFERDKHSLFSQVKKSGFDEDGYLINWPIGFFEPEE